MTQYVYRVPFYGLCDGNWHHLAIGVSAKRLTLHVDCSQLLSVDWEYRGMENSTAGLLMVGGIIEDNEPQFEVLEDPSIFAIFTKYMIINEGLRLMKTKNIRACFLTLV